MKNENRKMKNQNVKLKKEYNKNRRAFLLFHFSLEW